MPHPSHPSHPTSCTLHPSPPPPPPPTPSIPPYFALIIRAIGVLEGIALVPNPNFAIIDEAYPYISKMLLTNNSPRIQAALRYMVYGKEGVFDAERLIDILVSAKDACTRFAASCCPSLHTVSPTHHPTHHPTHCPAHQPHS